jgi:hypothetical protein
MKETFASGRVRWARARAVVATAAVLLTPIGSAAVVAQDEAATPAASTPLAEVPSSGAARSGPIRAGLAGRAGDAAVSEIVVRSPEKPAGVSPVAIQIDRFGIDAPIERAEITPEGEMVEPSGSFVVAWYHQLASLDQGDNVILSGHVDYWDADRAVFWNLDDPGLDEGDVIRIWGENDEVYEYEVEWSRLYDVATELTAEVIQGEITGDTEEESLTLITCGGAFNYDTDEYLYRVVVRATKI